MTIPRTAVLAACTWAAAALVPALAHAQLFTLTKDEMTSLTAQNPFDRFPDGRPKVPDSILERARDMSAEEVWAVLGNGGGPGRGYRNQYAGDFEVLHPGKTMAGRAFTVQFMPARPDLDLFNNAKAAKNGLPARLNNQTAIDMLQPGDVLVVDLMGKIDGGTIVGDNLFYYIMKTAKSAGLVVDGAIRDLQGAAEMDMPAYFRKAHPSAIADVTLTGINVPIRIGNATVLPGDMVVGDREGVYFVPPALAQAAVDNADTIHIHDEWTRMKFDEGKYKSSEIYGSPRDPALKKEYQDYLQKRLDEIHAKRAQPGAGK
jgi:4-hydroxy-4-methyl-2-oxoglutarate aldolase